MHFFSLHYFIFYAIDGTHNWYTINIEVVTDEPREYIMKVIDLKNERNNEILPRKHKMTLCIHKRKRLLHDLEHTILMSVKNHLKRKRKERCSPKGEKKTRCKTLNEYSEMSASELQQLSKETLIEYILDQQCRHKKAIDEIAPAGSQVKNLPTKVKKKKDKKTFMNVVKQLISNLLITVPLEYKDRRENEYTIQYDNK